jgi:hypothetical protein
MVNVSSNPAMIITHNRIDSIGNIARNNIFNDGNSLNIIGMNPNIIPFAANMTLALKLRFL